LNGKHVVFGNIIKGIGLLDILEQIEVLKDKGNIPYHDIKIEDCEIIQH